MLPRTVRPVLRGSLARPTPCAQLAKAALIPRSIRSYSSPPSTPAVELKKTPLHDLHVAAGAKMVPFAGYSMPVTYADQSLGDSHKHVRAKAGLFDVSHMVQHQFCGPAALEFLQLLTPSDLVKLTLGQSTLSVFLHPVTGGIVDDLMITLLGPENFYVVTNAACAEKDLAYINKHLAAYPKASNVAHRVLDTHGLIALQGPESRFVLRDFLQSSPSSPSVNLDTLLFGRTILVPTAEYGMLQIARGGYTGEDGFEISIPSADATTAVTRALLQLGEKDGRVKLAGLGARDSLRLEAGMCLYGHDLDDSTTPIEAGLKWLVGKRRVADGDFLGSATVGRQYHDPSTVERRRVGFIVEGAPAREGAELVNPLNEELIGKITSGCPSPTLGKNIAMGYVRSGFHTVGTEVGVKVRGRLRKAVVTKMPFVPTRYWKGPNAAVGEKAK